MKKVATANKEKPVNAIKDILFEESNRILTEDIAANMEMGKHGSQFIKTADTILTHCNAGALAAAGYGTALGVIRAAKEEGKDIKVFADDRSPVPLAARLTSY